jgi:hypothetical protein
MVSVYEKRAPVHTSFPDDYEGQGGLGKCQSKFIRYLEIETGPLAICLGVNYLLNETAEELPSKQSLVNKFRKTTLDTSASVNRCKTPNNKRSK